jgi:hypothetical protein
MKRAYSDLDFAHEFFCSCCLLSRLSLLLRFPLNFTLFVGLQFKITYAPDRVTNRARSVPTVTFSEFIEVPHKRIGNVHVDARLTHWFRISGVDYTRARRKCVVTTPFCTFTTRGEA